MSEFNPWIGWQGGACPVEPNDVVEIVLRGGAGDVCTAIQLDWASTGRDSDVVRYRKLVRLDTPRGYGPVVDQIAHKIITGQPAHDPVNKPSHYMLFPAQGIEFIDVRDVLIERLKDFSPKQIDYWSRAFEYLARAGGKNGVEDIKKAKWYLDRLVKTLEEKE